MNRRDFVVHSAMALFGFTILPGAGRAWTPQRNIYDMSLTRKEGLLSVAGRVPPVEFLEGTPNYAWMAGGYLANIPGDNDIIEIGRRMAVRDSRSFSIKNPHLRITLPSGRVVRQNLKTY